MIEGEAPYTQAAVEEYDITTQRSIFVMPPSKRVLNKSVDLRSKRKMYRSINDIGQV